MGDLDAKIGAVNKGYEQVIARHGVARMNENRRLFEDFCAQIKTIWLFGQSVRTQAHGDNSAM